MAEIDRYNFSLWQDFEIVIEPAGKAPKKYGEGVYRFFAAMTLSVIMPRRGWEVIKKIKSYVYMRPPGPPPFIVKIKLPSKLQAIELAESFYKDATSENFQIGELPGFYQHREPGNHFIHIQPKGTEPHQHVPTTIPRSWLHMGEFGFWEIDLKSFDGDWAYYEHGVVKPTISVTPNLLDDPDLSTIALVEGRVFDLTQTEYERNPIARKRCIEYYGCRCQICEFDFESKYGRIGQGFIHVHHIIPISEIGKQHEVDPIRDLIPLCANCHAIVHTRKPPYSIVEIKEALLNANNNKT